MSSVRLLVGTRKGAFVLTADGTRKNWQISQPHFAGWELYHLKGSPADPNRLYASQSSGWFGQLLQRSDDGGATWSPVDNKFAYADAPGTHQWYDGTPHPWEFKRVWHLEPSLTDPDTCIRRQSKTPPCSKPPTAAKAGTKLPGLRHMESGPSWQPGAGGMCLHTIILDPTNPNRIVIAISAAGAFRSDDAGLTWKPINKGLWSKYIPNPTAEVGHCVHHIAMHPAKPRNTLFMQKHWDVMRSDDAGDQWTKISGNLPTDFGFVIDVHSHEPETVYVVPIKSDSEHFPLDGQLKVFRSRSGGNEWEPLTRRPARSRTVTSTSSATPWPSTPSTTAASISAPPAARSTAPPTAATPGPPSPTTSHRSSASKPRLSHNPDAQDPPRAPATPAQPDRHHHARNSNRSRRPVSITSTLDALETKYPQLRGTIRDHVTKQRRPFLRFFANEQDITHQSPDTPLPASVIDGREPLIILGAIAGG